MVQCQAYEHEEWQSLISPGYSEGMDLDGFYAWLHKRGRGRSADQYRRVVKLWLDGKDEFEAKMTSTSYSPNYRRHLIACVRVWAKYTGDGDLLVRLEDIKRPAAIARDVREPFEFSDWFAIRNAIENYPGITDAKRNVCALIALRGIRCGDVLRLAKRDVSQAVDAGVLAFESKGERWQKFNAAPLLPHLKGLMGCWHHGQRVRNLVSPGSSEEHCQETAGRAIRRVFDEIADEIGMNPEDLYAHRFRHTYATYFLQEMAGDPEAIFKLQQQMGWARLDTASNYLRRSRQGELDAVEERLLGRK